VYQITKEFGSWNNYVIAAGGLVIISHYKPSENELLENYHDVKKRLGRVPRSREMKRPLSKYSLSQYLIRYNTWNSFLVKIGEIPHIKSRICTKDDLISYYYKIKNEKLGESNPRPLTRNEFGKSYRKQVKEYFGSYRNLVLELERTNRIVYNCSMCGQANIEFNILSNKAPRNRLRFCDVCKAIRHKESIRKYYDAMSEERRVYMKEYRKKYYKEHAEQERQRAKEYNKEHIEQIRHYAKEYTKEHAEQRRQYTKEYRLRHRPIQSLKSKK